jgi:hypothetical protein
MAWFTLVALGAAWIAFLLPSRRHHSPHRSVEDFERNMDLLADTGTSGSGRYIITPRKGMAFVGPRERAKERARERRRRVFVVMLESIGLSFLIGIAPPLRVMWYATAILLAALGVYVWMLLSMKMSADSTYGERVRASAAPLTAKPQRERYATDAAGRTPRPAFNGLASLGGEDVADIVVKPVRREVGVAGA